MRLLVCLIFAVSEYDETARSQASNFLLKGRVTFEMNFYGKTVSVAAHTLLLRRRSKQWISLM